MALGGLKRRWVTFRVNHTLAGTKAKHFEKKRRLLNSLGHEIDEGTRIVGPVFCTGKMIIGKNCWIGRCLTVNGNGTVRIGDNCDVAPEVGFQTGGHLIGSAQRRAGEGFNKDITVGNGCWLGARSTLLAGVTVGNGSVVASCACVNKDIDENVLAGGVPAKEIRKLGND